MKHKARRWCMWSLGGKGMFKVATIEPSRKLDGLDSKSIAEQIAEGEQVELNFLEAQVLPEGQRPGRKKR